MNLPEMYSLANSKSGFSRSDAEIYDALNEGGFRVYAATVKEFRGFFIKFDETSLTLVPGTQEYALPADCSQIMHLAERQSATQDWLPMTPLDLDAALTDIQQSTGYSDFFATEYAGVSEFGFYGPYLDATATQGVQTQKIRVAPGVDTNRFVQIAYTAKWLPIVGTTSKVMLSDEGTYAMLNFAIAELRRASDDSQSENYEDKGKVHLSAYLSWARTRQRMATLQIQPYGPGY